jgi:hypothetical protein
MAKITRVVSEFRKEPPQGRTGGPFRLVSRLSSQALSGEVDLAWDGVALPSDVKEFWLQCRDALLFEDADFGQWGLAILDPASSAARTRELRAMRPVDFQEDDVVVGAFLGDSELLVVAPTELGRRRILIALPLDGRSEWFGAGNDLGDFLESYLAAGGDKFWERERA